MKLLLKIVFDESHISLIGLIALIFLINVIVTDIFLPILLHHHTGVKESLPSYEEIWSNFEFPKSDSNDSVSLPHLKTTQDYISDYIR